MLKLTDIIHIVRGYYPQGDFDIIRKAYVYASKAHYGQFRKSGEPYFVHPLEVAKILAELKLDVASICTGLLHDTVEDTEATKEEINNPTTRNNKGLLGKYWFSILFNQENRPELWPRMINIMNAIINSIDTKKSDNLLLIFIALIYQQSGYESIGSWVL